MVNKLEKQNIPEGWFEINLGSLANLYQPETISKNQMVSDGKYLVFGANGIIGRYDKFNHENSEVIVTCRGASCGSVSLTPSMAWITGNAMVVSPDVKRVTKDYLLYLLKVSPLQSVVTGGAQPQITRAPISALKVVLPESKSEQKKIAEVLGAVDAEIVQTKSVIKATEKLKKGLMQQLFTRGIGHTKFKETKIGLIPEKWEVKTLQLLLDEKIIVDHLDGNHGELYPKSSEFVDGGVPYLSANCIEDGVLSFKKAKYLTKERAAKFVKGVAINGDVLFAHNATVGPVAILKTNENFVILSTTLTYYRVDEDKLSSVYLNYYMQSEYFIKQYSKVMAQTTRNQVPITMQRKLFHILPPTSEQKEIAEILSTVDEKISVNKKLLAKQTELKKGLMQDLLSGVKRVNT